MSTPTREQCELLGIPYVTHAYVGRKLCGCIFAAAIDNPHDPKQTLADINEFLGSGLILARVPIGEAVLSDKCEHGVQS